MQSLLVAWPRSMSGAASEVELKEKKARVEDALHSTRAAVEEGVVPGGGVSYHPLTAGVLESTSVPNLMANDSVFGVDTVADQRHRRCRCSTIADNAGEKGTVIVVQGQAEGEGAFGYNALTQDLRRSLIADGVLTPAKVDRIGIAECNASVAGLLLLSADCIITEAPVED